MTKSALTKNTSCKSQCISLKLKDKFFQAMPIQSRATHKNERFHTHFLSRERGKDGSVLPNSISQPCLASVFALRHDCVFNH